MCVPQPCPLPAAPCWPGEPLTLLYFQQYLCVADLARKDKRVLRKKYQIYFW